MFSIHIRTVSVGTMGKYLDFPMVIFYLWWLLFLAFFTTINKCNLRKNCSCAILSILTKVM